MTLSSLMAISPLEGRYQEKLQELRPIFSEYGLMKFRLFVEIRWLQLLTESDDLPELSPLSPHAQKLLNGMIENFNEQDAARIKHIENGINHDVKAIEYYLKERIAGNNELEKISEFIHFGCTSEDINNLSYALMLQTARKQIILPALDELLSSLKRFAHTFSEIPMLSRTHGQPATPTTLGKEIANFAARLQRQIEQLISIPILAKFNGASGNYNALTIAYPKIDWQELSRKFICNLGLSWNPYTTQIEPHDYMAEYFHVMVRINTILIDFNRDMWGYIALHYFQQKSFSHEVGSSVMPHKINPIDFENAEGNLGIANALFEHMAVKLPVSRWQRDLSDSTVLRNMGVAVSHSILAYRSTCKGLERISPHHEKLALDLNNHWEVLAEPIQTIMRRFGIEQPYEKLKTLTRGHKIDKATLHQFIKELDIPEEVKNQLYKLTPDNYLGYAINLAKRI